MTSLTALQAKAAQLFMLLQAWLASQGIVTPLADLVLGGTVGALLVGTTLAFARMVGKNVTYAPNGFFKRTRKLREQTDGWGDLLAYLPVPLITDLIVAVFKLATGFRRRQHPVVGMDMRQTLQEALLKIATQGDQLNAHREFTHSQLRDQQKKIERGLGDLENLKSEARPVMDWYADLPDEDEIEEVDTELLDELTDKDASKASTGEKEIQYEGQRVRRQMIYYNGSAQVLTCKYVDPQTGEDHGPFKSYHANGMPEEEGQYKRDKRYGEWKFYDSHGKLKRKVMYDDQGRIVSE